MIFCSCESIFAYAVFFVCFVWFVVCILLVMHTAATFPSDQHTVWLFFFLNFVSLLECSYALCWSCVMWTGESWHILDSISRTNPSSDTRAQLPRPLRGLSRELRSSRDCVCWRMKLSKCVERSILCWFHTETWRDDLRDSAIHVIERLLHHISTVYGRL